LDLATALAAFLSVLAFSLASLSAFKTLASLACFLRMFSGITLAPLAPFFPAAGLAAAYFFGGIFAINK